MGYDAVVDSFRLNDAMKATAEAIKEKMTDPSPIMWDKDTGFEDAVKGIDIDLRAHAVEDSFLTGSVTKIDNNRVEKLAQHVLRNVASLKTVAVNNASTIEDYALYSCTSLNTFSAEKATTIGTGAFYGDAWLKRVNIPSAETIRANAFYACQRLEVLILGDTPPTLENVNAFNNSSIKAGGTGYIYVPDVAVYQNAPNWSNFSDRFKPRSEVPA